MAKKCLSIYARWKYELFVELLEHVPWNYWDGDETENKLYKGDRPELYGRLKHAYRDR
jgi:hypothetical protein